MADTDHAIAEVNRKIDREKALINAATHMRQSTNNAAVQARVDSNIRDGRRNISYLEDKLRELQLRKANDGAPQPPVHGGRGRMQDGGPTPPPKDGGNYFSGERGDYGDPGAGGYSQGGAGMPSRAPYGDPRPYSAPMPKARPNFSKLGMLNRVNTWFQLTGHRSNQVRHTISGAQDSAHAIPTRIQT